MSEKTMNKIKINKQVEEEISVLSMLCLMKGSTAHELLDKFVELYKKTEGKKLFTAEETDSIVQILESMPGYTHEKFFTACTAINGIDEDNKMNVLQSALHVTYIMLSITNPELFENYKEEERNDIYILKYNN